MAESKYGVTLEEVDSTIVYFRNLISKVSQDSTPEIAEHRCKFLRMRFDMLQEEHARLDKRPTV